jgi:polysaccharide pyruvyl transferase WcaK-like protein
MAVVPIDTRLDVNATGLRTPREVESVIARMDVILTTRLHGMVLAIKNTVPPLVIDPVAGGHKIRAQARTIGWPVVFPSENLEAAQLESAFEYCLTTAARENAAECRSHAIRLLENAREQFLTTWREKNRYERNQGRG